MTSIQCLQLLVHEIREHNQCLTLSKAFDRFCVLCQIHQADNRINMALFSDLIRKCPGVVVRTDDLNKRTWVHA